MKKTMFITSIVMVVVLAVALTTSSLAWFSAAGATQVTVSQLKLQAKGRIATSGLEISNNSTVWSTTGINFQGATLTQGVYVGNQELYPICPVGTIGTVEDTDEIANNEKWVDKDFFAALNNTYSNDMYLKDGTTWTFQGTATDTHKPFIDTFYLRNSGENWGQVTITIKALSGTNRSYDATLWVAIFDVTDVVFNENTYTVASAEAPNQPRLLKLVSSQTNYTLVEGVPTGNSIISGTAITWSSDVAAMANEQPVSGMSSLALSRFEEKVLQLSPATYNQGEYVAASAKKLMVYAWYDGNELDNANSDEYVSIDVAFSISSIADPTQNNG